MVFTVVETIAKQFEVKDSISLSDTLEYIGILKLKSLEVFTWDYYKIS